MSEYSNEVLRPNEGFVKLALTLQMDAFWEFVGSWTFIIILLSLCSLLIPTVAVIVILVIVLRPKKRQHFDDEPFDDPGSRRH